MKSCYKLVPGDRKNRLTVIAEFRDEKGYYRVRCHCDCGKDTITYRHSYLSGWTKSCGCLQRETARKSVGRRGEFGESTFNALYNSYKKCARRRGLTFNLSKDDFRVLTKGQCHYCGKAPENKVIYSKTNYGYYLSNGIDRVNNSLGYQKENCVSCCKLCNTFKMQLSRDELLEHVKKIYTFNFVDTASNSSLPLELQGSLEP